MLAIPLPSSSRNYHGHRFNRIQDGVVVQVVRLRCGDHVHAGWLRAETAKIAVLVPKGN